MLSTYSVLMMLLIVSGSLIGISSIYQPVNVETQPQPQPQKPMIGSKIIVPKTIDPTAQRALEDRQLVDRLMPEIIKRIDVKLVLTQRPGQIAKSEAPDLLPSSNAVEARVRCQPGETAVSVGFEAVGRGDQSVYYAKRDNPNDPISNRPLAPTIGWTIRSTFDDGSGQLRTYVECLKIQLSVRPLTAQQPGSLGYLQEIPSQPRPPTQPPGGPPLQPPP